VRFVNRRRFTIEDMDLPFEIAPQELKAKLDAGEVVHLIDVRQPVEYQTAKIENSELIPMRSVPAELEKLEQKAESGTLIVICHHGVRSLQVVGWLREQGVQACQSLAGGIDMWSLIVDRSVSRY
jgi:rhodanese-related sulfurtransferase